MIMITTQFFKRLAIQLKNGVLACWLYMRDPVLALIVIISPKLITDQFLHLI